MAEAGGFWQVGRPIADIAPVSPPPSDLGSGGKSAAGTHAEDVGMVEDGKKSSLHLKAFGEDEDEEDVAGVFGDFEPDVGEAADPERGVQAERHDFGVIHPDWPQEEAQEARSPKIANDPGVPTRRERAEHACTHWPYRACANIG